MRKRKYVLLFLLAIAAIAAGFAYYSYTNTGVNVEKAHAEKISAPELYDAFLQDTIAAKGRYLNKVVEVSGTATRSTVNQQDQTIVLLQTSSGGAAINCTLEEKADPIREGQPVTLKCICQGLGEGDAELGIAADVYLVRCRLVKE